MQMHVSSPGSYASKRHGRASHRQSCCISLKKRCLSMLHRVLDSQHWGTIRATTPAAQHVGVAAAPVAVVSTDISSSELMYTSLNPKLLRFLTGASTWVPGQCVSCGTK